jgi:hypothetical protein
MNKAARIMIAHDQHHPVGDGEKRVPQYGPEWIAHVSAGGNVRNGNILVGAR